MPQIGKKVYPEGRYYISGPMTGIRNFNYRGFYEVADDLRQFGFDVASPSEIDFKSLGETYRGSLSSHVYLEQGLELLSKCDHIVMFGRWKRSFGATVEVETAEINGKTIFQYHPGGLFLRNPHLFKIDSRGKRK